MSESRRNPGAGLTGTSLRRWRPPAERALALGSAGPRLATLIAALDAATRGGLPLRKRVVLAGGPGAGKTTLAVQLLRSWALAGYLVAILAADEDADSVLVRWGQLEGLSREDLEAEGPNDAKRKLADIVSALGDRLLLADADDGDDGESVTVEQVSAELLRRREAIRGARGSVLLVDSIQTAAAAGTEEADSPRLRANAVLTALKRATKRDGHLVLATSEVARGSYGSRIPAERTPDLAAFKESGGIEYGADLALVLRVVATEGDLVDVTMPKNRLRGAHAPAVFRLQLDRIAARFQEVALPTEADQEAATERHEEALRARVVEVIRKAAAPVGSVGALKKMLRGQAPKASGKRWGEIITALVVDGVIGRVDQHFAILADSGDSGDSPSIPESPAGERFCDSPPISRRESESEPARGRKRGAMRG